jgi:hypothetical protein
MAIIYTAPKPKVSPWQWPLFIAIRILFPLILLWDLTKWGVNKRFGDMVGSIVLPAQKMGYYQLKIDEQTLNNFTTDQLVYQKNQITTHDDVTLDGIEIQYQSEELILPKHQKYIIHFLGNGMCYEQIIDDMKEDATRFQANIIGFNFRGVGQSTGKATSKNGLVTDGIAQVQRLLDQDVPPQNIILKGHSLGAGIATLVTQHFHQLRQPIHVFNSRSFSNITNVLVGQIQKATSKILGWLAYPIIKLAMALTQWEINAGSAFKKIPDAYRDYIVVRSRKEIRSKRMDDAVIPHSASIHKALTSERRKKKAEIDKEIQKIDNSTSMSSKERSQQKETLVQARSRINSDRKMEADSAEENGHNSDWDSLHNRSGTSARMFFAEFIKRSENDHGIVENHSTSEVR